MVRLSIHKKIKASSLTEVITATTILMIVFGIALVTLNNMMTTTLRKDSHKMNTQLEQLIYNYKNNIIKVPYLYKDDEYSTSVNKINNQSLSFIEFTITKENTNKTVSKRILVVDEEEE